MAASPTQRKTRIVRPANFATFTNGTNLTINFLPPQDPTGASSIFHLASDQDPSVSTPISLPPRGTVFTNLLAANADSLNSDAGIVSVHLGATLVAAGVGLTAVNLIGPTGAVIDTIFSDSTGIDGSLSTVIANVLTGIPVLSSQGVQVVLHNGTGSDIASGVSGEARFDLGIDVQQPDTNSVTKAL